MTHSSEFSEFGRPGVSGAILGVTRVSADDEQRQLLIERARVEPQFQDDSHSGNLFFDEG